MIIHGTWANEQDRLMGQMATETWPDTVAVGLGGVWVHRFGIWAREDPVPPGLRLLLHRPLQI